jgi:hypothetical protein
MKESFFSFKKSVLGEIATWGDQISFYEFMLFFSIWNTKMHFVEFVFASTIVVIWSWIWLQKWLDIFNPYFTRSFTHFMDTS